MANQRKSSPFSVQVTAGEGGESGSDQPRQTQEIRAEQAPVRSTIDNRGNRGGEMRSAMNHMRDDVQSVEIGGLSFARRTEVRGVMDAGLESKLHVPEDLKNDQLHYRWVHDNGDRVSRMVEKGYAVVDKSSIGGIDVRRIVGQDERGDGLSSVLMATPKKWKQERDDAKERERLYSVSDAMTRPQDRSGGLGGDFYMAPGTGITRK